MTDSDNAPLTDDQLIELDFLGDYMCGTHQAQIRLLKRLVTRLVRERDAMRNEIDNLRHLGQTVLDETLFDWQRMEAAEQLATKLQGCHHAR